MKIIRKNFAGILSLLALSAATAVPANAQLTSVSGLQAGAPAALTEVTAAGANADTAVSLATGFPIWYRDTSNRKLELCIDQTAVNSANNAIMTPCLTAAPFAGGPISFPNNFGAEAFYWAAVGFNNLLSANVNGVATPWNALIVMAQEAGFFTFGTEGNQAVFSRIRLRITVPVPGTYRVTHPYGTRDYLVTAADVGAERNINQTQDLGLFIDLLNPAVRDNFLTSLSDRPAAQLPVPIFPAPAPASISAAPNGIVDDIGKSIGPFLVSSTFVTALLLPLLRAGPGSDIVAKTVTINNGPNGNVFSIQLIGDATGNIGVIPAGVVLNPLDINNPQLVTISQFQLVGKLFNDGPNTVPVAAPINVVTGTNTPVNIDVAPFVEDVVSVSNVHGINPQAISVFDTATGNMPRSASFVTANNGTVQRFVNTGTGKTTFNYTPATGFFGQDSFQYVVQDTGGLIAAPATVSILVENLTAKASGAEFRPKFGKWRVEGTSSTTTNNLISIASDPVATISGASVIPAVTSQAKGTASLVVGRDTINYSLNVSPLPATAITSIHINQGAVGFNGPVLFVLYDNQSGPVSLPLSGQLTLSNLLARPNIGISTFLDAVSAILSGNAYINVITTANSSGEIRGQLLGKTLGNTSVASDGSWKFNKKTMVNPQGVRGVNAVSGNGVRLLGIPVSIR
jgi:CHRD domain